MSKSSTASSSKIATPLPLKSAWSRGPPQTSSQAASPRSQSPAQNNSPTTPFHQTHSRRSSTLGQGVPIKDGVSVARSVGAFKQGSAVTFGSIDDVSAPISSSPAATPAIKAEGVKTFGTVPAAINTSHVNGKTTVPSFIPPKPPLTPSTSTSSAISTPSVATPSTTPSSTLAKPTMDRRDIAKLFQGGGSNFSNIGPSPSTSDTASPSLRPSNLPQQQNQPSSSQHQQSPMLSQAQFGAQPYSTFVPAMRPPPQQNGGSGPVPRSPVNSRQIPNGNGFRTPSGPNGPGPGPPPMSAGLSSPRLTPHHHPSTPSGMPSGMPPSVPGWSYYYPGLPMDQQQYMHYPQYYMPQPPIPHQHQHPHQQHSHLPPPGSQGPPPLSGMSMSPRPAPMPLQGPGTPTQSHAPINTAPSPLPQLNHTNSSSLSGLSSPPPTPSSPSIPMPGSARLNPTLSAFVPRQRIVIKNAEGQEVDLRTSVKQGAPPSQAPSVTPSHQPRKPSVRIESEDAKKKRVEEEERLQEKERAKQERDKELAQQTAEEKEKKDNEEKTRKERTWKETQEEEKEGKTIRRGTEQQEREEKIVMRLESEGARRKRINEEQRLMREGERILKEEVRIQEERDKLRQEMDRLREEEDRLLLEECRLEEDKKILENDGERYRAGMSIGTDEQKVWTSDHHQ